MDASFSACGTSLEALRTFIVDARQRRLVTADHIAERIQTMPRAPGRSRVIRVLQELSVDGSDSLFESKVRERLRSSGFQPSPGPFAVALPDGRTIHLDIAFPRERVAIECQGFLAHSSRDQLNRDARRENAIALVREWLILKLTWDRFLHDWAGFEAELRRALRDPELGSWPLAQRSLAPQIRSGRIGSSNWGAG